MNYQRRVDPTFKCWGSRDVQERIGLRWCLSACCRPRCSARACHLRPRLVSPRNVFVTASVAPLPAAAVARDINVITRSDLDLFGLRSIIDALRLVPGVDA